MAIALYTPLDVEECARRLAAAAEGAAPPAGRGRLAFLKGLLPQGEGPKVLVQLRGRKVRLHRHRAYRDPFAPIFHGTLAADERRGGAWVVGDFRLNPVIYLVMLAGFVVWLGLISASRKLGGIGLPQLLPLPAIGLGLFLAGRLAGRRDEGVLIRFLERTLDAKRAEPGG